MFTTFSAADWESYKHLVGWLRDTDVASHALKVGAAAPDFLLPDADGRLHSSEQLRRNGALVLSFFRGGWYPFCTAELCALQAAKDEFESVGATLAVVTPETRHFPRQLKRSPGLDLKVLSDIDYVVAVSYGAGPQPLVHAFAVTAPYRGERRFKVLFQQCQTSLLAQVNRPGRLKHLQCRSSWHRFDSRR